MYYIVHTYHTGNVTYFTKVRSSNLIDATTSKPRSCFWAASKNHSFSKRGFLCSKSTSTSL